MKAQTGMMLESCRVRVGRYASTRAYGFNGMFLIPLSSGVTARAIASDGSGWDHVSVTIAGEEDRTPTWEEMSEVKRIFFRPEETVVQFHPAASEYVNCHPHCLHLWRNQARPHELPPGWMIGPRSIVEPKHSEEVR